MIKRALLAAPVSLALLVAATPLTAQDETADEVMVEEEGEAPLGEDPFAGLGAMFGEMFKVEPLTAEQEARLPAATRVAGQILPDGTLAKMVDKLMGDFLTPIIDLAPPPANSTIATGLGISTYELDLTEEQTAELAALIDPAWEERDKREKEVFPKLMGGLMNAVEPGMRKAMAELYAIRFEEAELGQLETFFNTELGAKFASESYAMATDPRIFAATFELMPQIMGAMSDMKSAVDEATADLPPKRQFSELSATQKARVSELTGLSTEEIEERIAAAAEPEGWTEDLEGEAEAAEAPE